MDGSDQEGGELNIVPFLDIIVNVMMFVLATLAVTFTTTVDTTPPSLKPNRGTQTPLGLSILVVEDGFSVKTTRGPVARVPRGDYAQLKRVVTELKSTADFQDEDSVTLSASPEIKYEALIATMDAVRMTDDGKALFPDVAFGVVR